MIPALYGRWTLQADGSLIYRFLSYPFPEENPGNKIELMVELITPENTITYHNDLCLLPWNIAKALFSVSLVAVLIPKWNWRQSLGKILEWQTKRITVRYSIFWSGQLCYRITRNLIGPFLHWRSSYKHYKTHFTERTVSFIKPWLDEMFIQIVLGSWDDPSKTYVRGTYHL